MERKQMTKLTVLYFVIAAILAVSAASLAAYTSLSSVKRVVTVKGTEQLFTSDVLLEYGQEKDIQSRVISFVNSVEEKSFTFKVSNHIQGDDTKYDSQSIKYDLKVSILDLNGAVVQEPLIYTLFTVNGAQMTTNPFTLSEQNLTGGISKDNDYVVVMPGAGMTSYKIKISAIPSNRGNYKSIGRIITFAIDQSSTNWTGEFLNVEKEAVNSGDTLGIINYRISGQIEEDCVLSWDTSRVEIDQWFLDKFQVTPSQKGTKKTVSLHLGEAGTPNQYTITFFRTCSTQDVTEDWNTIKNYISFTNSKK